MIIRNVPKLIFSTIKNSKSLSTQGDQGWELMSAVCLERLPVVTQTMNKLEQDYSEMLRMLEKEGSLLSDHTLRHLEDLKVAEKKKADEWMEEEAEVQMQTALEQEDQWNDELRAFKAAPRVTETDLSHNTRSLSRRLDRKLVLLAKQMLGASVEWVCPMGVWKEGESLRQSAERVLGEVCGSGLKATFMGNVPCGFYQYKYPPGLTHVGAKVFFFKAQYKAGHVAPKSGSVLEHQWLLKEELHKHSHKRYANKINKFVLEI